MRSCRAAAAAAAAAALALGARHADNEVARLRGERALLLLLLLVGRFALGIARIETRCRKDKAIVSAENVAGHHEQQVEGVLMRSRISSLASWLRTACSPEATQVKTQQQQP